MVVCPACGSSRIRHDYRPAPIYLRIFLVRALLCDHCNRQFRAFSLRMPGARQSTRPKRRADTFVAAPVRDEAGMDLPPAQSVGEERRVLLDQIINRQNRPGEAPPRVESRGDHPPVRPARTSAEPGGEPVASLACPACGSSSVKRRPRRPLERILLSITDHRAYVCRDCQHSFYSRSGR